MLNVNDNYIENIYLKGLIYTTNFKYSKIYTN